MMSSLRRYLLAGIVALAPLLVTVALINWLVEISDQAMALLPEPYKPSNLLGLDLPGVGILLALVFIVVIGALTTHFVGSYLMGLVNRAMERIPVIRTVYKATRQLLESIFSDSAKAFQRVVLVQFPGRGRWVMGFVAGQSTLPTEHGSSDPLVSVFIPSTPLPTTGWLLFVDEAELVQLDMSVEAGMKLVLSGGTLPPVAATGGDKST